jgi:hypothetical protein
MSFRLACLLIILCSSLLPLGCHGFAQISSTRGVMQYSPVLFSSSSNGRHNEGTHNDIVLERRDVLQQLSTAAFVLPIVLTANAAGAAASSDVVVMKDDPNAMFAPKFVQQYEDFIVTPEGWSYRDVKPGKGDMAALNDRVVYDWSGYTIGYFGRPFQAKGGPQGVRVVLMLSRYIYCQFYFELVKHPKKSKHQKLSHFYDLPLLNNRERLTRNWITSAPFWDRVLL